MRRLRPLSALLVAVLLAPMAPALCASGGDCAMGMMDMGAMEMGAMEMGAMAGDCHRTETASFEDDCCCLSPAEAPRSAQESPAAAPFAPSLEPASNDTAFRHVTEPDASEAFAPPERLSPIPRGSLERLSLLSVFLI